MKQNNKTHIMARYTVISLLFLLISGAVVVKLFDTSVLKAEAWNKRADEELSKVDTIAPERGNILACNGSILACNVKVYDIRLDLRHNKIVAEKSIPWDTIHMLADSLDKYYPRVADLNADKATYEKYSWHTRLKEEFEKAPDRRARALRIARDKGKEDFERIRAFPYLNRFKGSGFKNPLYTEEKNKRIYPFGRMAHRSIGRVNERPQGLPGAGQIHGYSGLEADLDSLLYGEPGLAKRVALTNGISRWMQKDTRRGYDLVTTIDIDIQEMLEEELAAVCREAGAEWGTALIMEVATGEIKAISNVEKLADGTYGEALNRAVQAYEPGSVMKPISLMIAFEDGLVKNVTDVVDCSPFQRTSDPHAPGVKNMKQVIEMSSNTGIARVIFRGYAQDPAKFYDRLASIGFFEPMNTGICGECTPRIRRLEPTDARGNNITMTARHLDLARQAYGYNTEIPPLYTLSIYNAIANGGRYVRPHLLKALRDENGLDSVLPITYIRDRICSEETARKVRQCIREVVWGEHGTARAVQDDRVEVVGKTGTAFPVGAMGYDKSRRRYAFAGFFPYDEPRYSCMALVLASAGTSANRTSGQVVKNVAVKMYARGMFNNTSDYMADRKGGSPVMTASTRSNLQAVNRALDTGSPKRLKAAPAGSGKGVPDVRGYDAPSAVAMLESRGLNVRLSGHGHVVAQSLAPGADVRKGQTITLKLKI